MWGFFLIDILPKLPYNNYMKKHFVSLIASLVCFTASADTIPEPGLATPAYIPPIAIYVQPEPVRTQTVYVQQPVYVQPQPTPTYYVQQTVPDRYSRFAAEREQMFGNAYIRR